MPEVTVIPPMPESAPTKANYKGAKKLPGGFNFSELFGAAGKDDKAAKKEIANNLITQILEKAVSSKDEDEASLKNMSMLMQLMYLGGAAVNVEAAASGEVESASGVEGVLAVEGALGELVAVGEGDLKADDVLPDSTINSGEAVDLVFDTALDETTLLEAQEQIDINTSDTAPETLQQNMVAEASESAGLLIDENASVSVNISQDSAAVNASGENVAGNGLVKAQEAGEVKVSGGDVQAMGEQAETSASVVSGTSQSESKSESSMADGNSGFDFGRGDSATIENMQAIFNTEFVDRTSLTLDFNSDYSKVLNDRLNDIIRTAVMENRQQIEIQIHPENLGKIVIKLTSTEQGIDVKLDVKNQLVKDVLTQNLANLAGALKESNVQIGKIFVDIENLNEQTPRQKHENHSNGQERQEEPDKEGVSFTEIATQLSKQIE